MAELDRHSQVFVSGSSVTGVSYASRAPFRAESDIDIGIASRALFRSGQVHQTGRLRGFPIEGTSLSRAERFRRRTVTDHPMGIRVYDADTAAEAVPRRQVIVRPHTPESERRTPVDVDAEMARRAGRGRGGRGGFGRGGRGGGFSGRGRGGFRGGGRGRGTF